MSLPLAVGFLIPRFAIPEGRNGVSKRLVANSNMCMTLLTLHLETGSARFGASPFAGARHLGRRAPGLC